MTCLRSHPHEPEESCDGSVRHLYAQGAHDERERIIALLLTDKFHVWIPEAGDLWPAAEADLRKMLKP